jgi:integrase/recombinase XerD
MKSTSTLIGPLLQQFFVEHLMQHKHVSPQTTASYRDSFRLLLQYAKKHLKTEPVALEVKALDAPVILSFLDSLEKDRHNSARSHNVRLAAIRSFFRWLTLRDPEMVGAEYQSKNLAPHRAVGRPLVCRLAKRSPDILWVVRRVSASILYSSSPSGRISTQRSVGVRGSRESALGTVRVP